MKLGIIILNWNDLNGTSQCLQSISAWTSLDYEIIVVDNASQDRSAKEISDAFPEIKLVQSDRNRGFAGGNNLGIEKARELGCEAILLLNSDAEISEDDVSVLIKTVEENENPVIVGPAIMEKSASGSTLTCGGRDIGKYSRTRIISTEREPTTVSVNYVPGTVLLAPITIFNTTGLLDENYFFSGEVADFCAQARTKGIRCLINMNAVAEHGDEDEVKPLRGNLYIYYTLRNRFLYVYKHGGFYKYVFIIIWILKAIAMFGISIIKLDFSRARAIAFGLIHGIQKKWGNQNHVFGV